MNTLRIANVVGLFQIGTCGPDRPTCVYFLLANDLAIEPPTLEELFDRVDLAGWYVFSAAEIRDPVRFKAIARSSFPDLKTWPANQLPRGVVWLPDPNDPSSYTDWLVFRKNSPSPQVPRVLADPHTFQLSGFALSVGTTVNVRFDPSSASLELYTSDFSAVQIRYNGDAQTLGYPPDWVLPIPLLSDVAGALELQVGLDGGTLQETFGCTFTYYYVSGSDYGSLAYPCFPPIKPAQQSKYWGFNVRIHPLHHLDAAQTRLALDLSGLSVYSKNSQKLQCTYFRSINGTALTLTPVDLALGGEPCGAPGSPDVVDAQAAGFGFCVAPLPGTSVSSPPETVYALAPVGMFCLTGIGNPATGAQLPVEPGDEVRLMGGLFGQEFVQLSIGDALELVSGRAAFAPGFRSDGGGDTAGDQEFLTDLFTTSWVRFPVDPGVQLKGYFSQPSSSVFYAVASGDSFPMAVDALLSPLSEPTEFPVVPYGGVFTSAQAPKARRARANGRATTPTNGTPPPFALFESAVLSAARHQRFAIPGRGPVFQSSRPVLSRRTASARALARSPRVSDGPGAPTAMTPQGFLVNLHPDGEWESVLLARSPDTATECLRFSGASGSPPTVSPELASTLMQNQLALVVTNPTPLGDYQSQIALRGFHFDLSVGPTESVLVFKFNTSLSLEELAHQPALWSSASTFVGDDAAILCAQGVILDAIRVAKQEADTPGRPFDYFNRIVSDPSWTGVLAFNGAINGNGMPAELQMLLGGINGQLRAHHFGVETNRVLQSPDGDMSVDRSSMFGVIHYEATSTGSRTGDFDYAVETLTVVFSNSKIAELAVSVGLTINRLFGRGVQLVSSTGSPDAANTLVIHGRYQSQGTVGTVVFVSQDAFVYEFPVPANATRVTDRVEITHASLAPTSSTPLGSPAQGTHIQATFAMSGDLWFAPAPFPNTDELDLFSYGNPVTGGMAFTALTVSIDFDLDGQGKLAPGSETIALQPSLLTFAPASSAIRPGSLLESLPLQFSRFWYEPSGLKPAQLGAVPVNCLQLEGSGGVSSPGETGPYPFVATTPQYALEFELPLGSLGSLSEVTVGIVAKLLLAWGPSSVVPDNDAAAVLVQLPSVFGGVAGFSLQGILRTTFGDANLLKVDVGGPVYAILFNNIKFSLLGFSFPPGVLIDFIIFAGQPGQGQPVNNSNVAWYLAAQPESGKQLTT